MMNYFINVLPFIDIYFDFHLEKSFRSLLFTTYCRKKYFFDKLCKRIIGKYNNDEIIIGFGNYQQHGGLKCEHPNSPIIQKNLALGTRREILKLLVSR